MLNSLQITFTSTIPCQASNVNSDNQARHIISPIKQIRKSTSELVKRQELDQIIIKWRSRSTWLRHSHCNRYKVPYKLNSSLSVVGFIVYNFIVETKF